MHKITLCVIHGASCSKLDAILVKLDQTLHCGTRNAHVFIISLVCVLLYTCMYILML